MASPNLFPNLEKSGLIGIARLAAEGESLREGHNVEYFTLPARSLLNRCNSQRGLPFTWTINPYRGCEFACKYCYARYTHEFMEMRDGTEFEQKIYVKQHTAELLRHDLRRACQVIMQTHRALPGPIAALPSSVQIITPHNVPPALFPPD